MLKDEITKLHVIHLFILLWYPGATSGNSLISKEFSRAMRVSSRSVVSITVTRTVCSKISYPGCLHVYWNAVSRYCLQKAYSQVGFCIIMSIFLSNLCLWFLDVPDAKVCNRMLGLILLFCHPFCSPKLWKHDGFILLFPVVTLICQCKM